MPLSKPKLITRPKVAVARGTARLRTDAELHAVAGAEALKALQQEVEADWSKHAPRKYKSALKAKVN